MNLEELIYVRFLKSERLIRQLTTFAGHPAIFCPEAPDDNQPGWNGEIQYPQMVYSFDMQANQERKSAGILTVSLLCQNSMDVTPEKIELEVKDCLRDVLLKPDNGVPYAFSWARTDAFTIQEEQHDLVIGSEIRFDILEYAFQETSDPDPIEAANQYIKGLYPECFVVGLDQLETMTEASKEVPVIYCRLISSEKGRETNTVAWMDGKIAVHIYAQTAG